MMSPLLLRTPSKMSPLKKAMNVQGGEESSTPRVPLLARSPFKKTISVVGTSDQDQNAEVRQTPLLAQSPMRASVKIGESVIPAEKPMSTTPLLARTPTKVPMPKDAPSDQASQIAGKSQGNSIMGRFNLLRSSPMKSILRSPQRLPPPSLFLLPRACQLQLRPVPTSPFRPDPGSSLYPSIQTRHYTTGLSLQGCSREKSGNLLLSEQERAPQFNHLVRESVAC